LERGAIEMLALKADVFLNTRVWENDCWRVFDENTSISKNVRNTSIPVSVQLIYVKLHFHV